MSARLSSRTAVLGLILLASGAVGGCAAAGRATGSESAAGERGVVWDAPPDVVDPPSADRNTLYVQVQDASGRNIELRNDVRAEFSNRGYTLTMDPDRADYKVQVTIVSFDRSQRGDHQDATGRVLTSGSTDAASQAARSVTGWGVLGTVGQSAAQIFGVGVAENTTAREWSLVAALTIAERVPEGVETSISSGKVVDTGLYSGRANASGAAGGVVGSRNEQSQHIVRSKNHLEFNRTLTAHSSKWFQSEDEARQALLPRVVTAIANALPSRL